MTPVEIPVRPLLKRGTVECFVREEDDDVNRPPRRRAVCICDADPAHLATAESEWQRWSMNPLLDFALDFAADHAGCKPGEPAHG